LPLGAKGPYTVRLLFAAVDGEKAGQRVFDVKLQGRAVLAGFDVATESGGALKAVVKEFKAVQGGESLILELVPKGPTPDPASMPIISGIELIAEASQ
jgi:hypothetical protein